jgi:hypothetical protein
MSGATEMGRRIVRYTLHSGHAAAIDPAVITEQQLGIIRPAVVEGDHAMPLKGYIVSVAVVRDVEGALAGAYVLVSQQHRSVAAFAVALTSDVVESLWRRIERLYLRATDQGARNGGDWASPHVPDSSPWVVWFSINCNPAESVLIDHFTRAWGLAFALLSHEELRQGNA